MVKVYAILSGRNVPSSRFRVQQYIPYLKEYGIEVISLYAPIEKDFVFRFVKKFKIRTRYILPLVIPLEILKLVVNIPRIYKANKEADIIWIQKNINTGIVFWEYLLKKPKIFDFDDAVWTNRPFGLSAFKQILKTSDIAFAGNNFLKSKAIRFNKEVHVIPTAVDHLRFKPTDSNKNNTSYIIGWTGSGINLEYLYQIEKSLNQILSKYKNFKLHVISDSKPNFKYISGDKIIFTEWSVNNEVRAMERWNLGLMPLSHSEFSKGKCSFKMLIYMSIGIPVVVSDYGMNRELLRSNPKIGIGVKKNGSWAEAIEKVFQTDGKIIHYGKEGRNTIINHFSTEKVAENIAQHILHLKK